VLAFRLSCGLTCEELAARIGEKPATVWAWEQHRDRDFRLRLSQWVRLVEFFGPAIVPT